MGGLVTAFLSPIVDINSTSAFIVASVCPGNFLILQFHKLFDFCSSNLQVCAHFSPFIGKEINKDRQQFP